MGFAWSYSKLQAYEDCPRRHQAYAITKEVQDGDSDQLRWGNAVHDAMAKALKGEKELPTEMATFQPWVDKVRNGPGRLLVEQKYALTKEFTPVPWMRHPGIWYRGIVDAARINGPVGLAIDWKTGAPKDNSVQLALMAACMFANYPELKKIRTEFVWLGDDCTTPEIFDRADIRELWNRLLPRIATYEQAIADQNFPPKPGGLCMKWCGVSNCPFYKKGTRG